MFSHGISLYLKFSQGPLKKWTEHFTQSHFLKLQLWGKLGRTPGLIGFEIIKVTKANIQNRVFRPYVDVLDLLPTGIVNPDYHLI